MGPEPPAASPFRNEDHERTTVLKQAVAWKTAACRLGGRERQGHSRLPGPSLLNDLLAACMNVFSHTFRERASVLEGVCWGSAP